MQESKAVAPSWNQATWPAFKVVRGCYVGHQGVETAV